MKYKKNYGFRLKKASAMGAPPTPPGKVIAHADYLKSKCAGLERENAELRSCLRDMICFYKYKIKTYKEEALLKRAEALVKNKGG